MTFDLTPDRRPRVRSREPATGPLRPPLVPQLAARRLTGASSFEQCLNGLWKFHYAKNPALVVPGFERLEADCSSWDDIPVPAHIQLQGYDRPQYTNVQYPWDGQEAVEPGAVPAAVQPGGAAT